MDRLKLNSSKLRLDGLNSISNAKDGKIVIYHCYIVRL